MRQVAHRRAAGLTHSPGVWLLESGEDATQRGLAGTVRTDEPDALASGDLPGEILEEVLATKAFRDALGLDQHLPHSLYVLGQYLDRDANLARAPPRVTILADVLLGQRVDVRLGALLR